MVQNVAMVTGCRSCVRTLAKYAFCAYTKLINFSSLHRLYRIACARQQRNRRVKKALQKEYKNWAESLKSASVLKTTSTTQHEEFRHLCVVLVTSLVGSVEDYL